MTFLRVARMRRSVVSALGISISLTLVASIALAMPATASSSVVESSATGVSAFLPSGFDLASIPVDIDDGSTADGNVDDYFGSVPVTPATPTDVPGVDGTIPRPQCVGGELGTSGEICIRTVTLLRTSESGQMPPSSSCITEDTVGIRTTYKTRYDSVTGATIGNPYNFVTICISQTRTPQTLKCISHLNASVNQVAPGNKARSLVSKSKRTVYGNGNSNSYPNCSNTLGKRHAIAVDEPLVDFGRYEAAAVVYYRMMQVDNLYNPITKKTTKEVTGVSGLRSSTNRNYAEVTCKGAAVGGRNVWKSSDFTMKPCISGKETRINYTCDIPNKAKINGMSTNKASVFRDGNTNTVDFGTPKLKGKGLIASSVKVTKTQLHRSGTPWRNNVSAGKNTFQIRKKGVTNPLSVAPTGMRMNGAVPAYDVRGFDATSGNRVTKLQNEYDFFGTWRVNTYKITSISAVGVPSIEVVKRNIDSTVVCKTPTVSMNFVRGVTSQ